MRCEQSRDLLSPYLDRACSEKENKMVEEHLAVCSHCRQELGELRRLAEALNQLAMPPLPFDFAEGLRNRLNQENTLIFSQRDLKQPRRQSWIAAAMAGLALAGGIYASTVLPVGSMVASWQNQDPKEGKKPVVAINKVIERFTQTTKDKVPVENGDVAKVAEKNGSALPVTNGTNDNQPKTNGAAGLAPAADTTKPVTTANRQATPRLAETSSTRLMVKDAGKALEQVVQIADAGGFEHNYNSNGCDFQALSGPDNARGVTLKVNRKDVDKVLNQLVAVGKTTAPFHNTVEISDKFKEVENKIEAVKQDRDVLAAKPVISPEEQTRLNELNVEMQALIQQQADLEKEVDLVTLNIYFVEEVNP